MIASYDYQGRTYSIQLDPLGAGRYRVTLGERSYEIEVQSMADGGWLLRMNGESLRAYGSARGDERYIALQGENYTLRLPETHTRQRQSARAGDLTAQMPGQVTEVRVKAGDEVRSGQVLLIMEAMKMEIRVSAPRDGQVRQVFVTVGGTVERGQRLIDLD